MWKSRWLSWAPVPNKPMVSVDVRQHFDEGRKDSNSPKLERFEGCGRSCHFPSKVVPVSNRLWELTDIIEVRPGWSWALRYGSYSTKDKFTGRMQHIHVHDPTLITKQNNDFGCWSWNLRLRTRPTTLRVQKGQVCLKLRTRQNNNVRLQQIVWTLTLRHLC